MDLTYFNWIQLIKKAPLPSQAKLIAFYLSTFMNAEHDIAWPAQSRISQETGLSEPTVRKYLQVLESNNWLISRKKVRAISHGAQNYYHNEYLINVPEQRVRALLSDIEQRIISLPSGGEQRVKQKGAEGNGVTPNNNRITNKDIYAQSEFERFWKSYPRKVAKEAARKAWRKIKPTDIEVILADIHSRKLNGWGKPESLPYIPYPATYLNGLRWKDQTESTEQPCCVPGAI